MSNPLADVERFAIHTSDGLGLRAELLGAGAGYDEAPRALAVICHPHPLHGGNMHNHVVSGLFTGLPALGVASLRFNFRGTSGSEGRHGGGVTERFDVLAAVEAITNRFRAADGRGAAAGDQAAPVVLVGYSFGALVALSVDHPAVGAWLAIAPPLTMVDANDLAAAGDARPTVVLAGTDDDFSTAADVERLTTPWQSTRVVPLPGEDHFLATAAASLQREAAALIGHLAGT